MLMVSLPAYAQKQSVWVDDLTWPEVRDAIAAGKRTAIIYTGSSEQNGPHMVIGKHNFIARAMGQRIAEELGDALVYATMPYAITGDPIARTGHMRFPGSVTLPPEVFYGVVRGAAQSALTAGFKVVALMGEHGGGQNELALAARSLDPQARAAGGGGLFIGDLYEKSRVMMREVLAKRGLPTDEDHAGIPDTSSLLYLQTKDEWVRQDKIAQADDKNGVRGHPQLASAELGKIYLDIKVELAIKQIRAQLANSK